jgi:hypothetical protein
MGFGDAAPGVSYFLAAQAPHLALAPHLAAVFAPHFAPHFAAHFGAHLALAALAAQADALALQAPHLVAVCFAPHLAPHLLGAQAAKTLPLIAAAVTTAEAKALDRVEESWLMRVSWNARVRGLGNATEPLAPVRACTRRGDAIRGIGVDDALEMQ